MEGTTGYYDSNLNGKASKAAELLTTDAYDFGFVHVKATDDAGHDKSHELKTQQLEKCDAMIATFIEAFRNQKKPGQETAPTDRRGPEPDTRPEREPDRGALDSDPHAQSRKGALSRNG